MARPRDLSRVANDLAELQRSLRDVARQTRKLTQDLVGGFERTLISRIEVFGPELQRRLERSIASIQPLVELLGGVAKSAAWRVRSAVVGTDEAAGPRRRRPKGKRGVRVNLTAEEIQKALDEAGGVKAAAARILGVSTVTFNKKVAAAGIHAPGGKGGRPKAASRGANKAADAPRRRGRGRAPKGKRAASKG